jgi:hypothetical protein
MQMVVLGTSNCIGPDSFVEQLCAQTSIKLRNLSIGACSSNLGLYQLNEIRPTVRGIGVIDFAINDSDTGLNLWGASNAGKIISDNIRTIAIHLRSNDYLPVVMIAPADLNQEMELFAETLHREICFQESINFINIREMFRSILRPGARQTNLMRDEYHMSRNAAAIVAKFFSRLIDEMRRSTPLLTTRVATVTASEVIPAQKIFARNALVERGSTLRKALHGQLHAGDVIRIPARYCDRVTALMINSAAKGAMVAFRGSENKLVKQMTAYGHAERPDHYSALLVDIGETIRGGDDGVTVGIVPRDAIPTEPTIHAHPNIHGQYGDGEVEIEGILLTSIYNKEIRFIDARYDWMPIDLGHLSLARQMLGELLKL